ncbi:hypothetical protein CQW23_00672 [Capsicum baccatum]|uniref:Uncharacterized protein n=1 Tax=Capsicum baccatum TaxID=33114 RepID=A0A2G2XLH4_CAPBA|nr:hypothetical protein CQW23_00672 [Capsicum baccatum]
MVRCKQKHLKKYADWYSSRGYHVIMFTFPMSEILSYQVGGKAKEDIELLVNHRADWLEEKHAKSLVFHTFSNTEWLTYGVILEKFQKQDHALMRRIKGAISFLCGSAKFSKVLRFSKLMITNDQYKWLEKDLTNVDRTVTPWLVVFYPSNFGRLHCFRLLLLLQEVALFQIVASVTEDCTASESCNSSTKKHTVSVNQCAVSEKYCIVLTE